MPDHGHSPDGPHQQGLLAVTGAQVTPVPPPLYYAAALAGGLLLQQTSPLDVPRVPAWSGVGVALLAAGLSLNFGAVAAVIRNRTTLVPHRRVRVLLTRGVYRITRNPMYTGLAMAVAGAALAIGTWWPALLLAPTLVVVRRLVIEPEERYLHDRFGAVYDIYSQRVPRWL